MLQNINSVFTDRGEIPLFYVESGSRLWGIDSPDSDYDVRGIHIQSKKQYYDFRKQRDLIDLMDGEFDFVSYDIDKMFALLLKSNAKVFEWIRSHIVYLNKLPNWEEFQSNIISNYNLRALFHHYLASAEHHLGLMGKDKNFTYKTTFYCIRGLLSAEIAAKEMVPELLIDKLFDQFETENDVIKIANETLEKKRQKAEKEKVEESEKQIIISTIKKQINSLEPKIIDDSDKHGKLEKFLKDYSYKLKSHFYTK